MLFSLVLVLVLALVLVLGNNSKSKVFVAAAHILSIISCFKSPKRQQTGERDL